MLLLCNSNTYAYTNPSPFVIMQLRVFTMTPAPTKRRDANGKFAKKNPDCEPATRGYVKCVARSISKHDHRQRCLPPATVLVFSVSVTIAIVSSNPFASVVAIVSAAVVIDLWFMLDGTKTHDAELESPESIQKYEPQCEPKRGCGEREG